MNSNEYFKAILHNFTLGLNDRSIYGAGVSRPQTQKLRPPTPPPKKSGKNSYLPPPRKKKIWKTQTPPPTPKKNTLENSDPLPPQKKKSGKTQPPPEKTKKRHFVKCRRTHKKHIILNSSQCKRIRLR